MNNGNASDIKVREGVSLPLKDNESNKLNDKFCILTINAHKKVNNFKRAKVCKQKVC